jgi:hypothetical protein
VTDIGFDFPKAVHSACFLLPLDSCLNYSSALMMEAICSPKRRHFSELYHVAPKKSTPFIFVLIKVIHNNWLSYFFFLTECLRVNA